MVNEQDIEKAIDALDRQLIPNYSQVARDFGIERTTLMRRHKGICTSRQEATSLYHKLLTDTQEEALISQINKLTVRGLPPTSQIVKNLAEEIISGEVNKNWTASFVQRHSSRLKSLYLRNIDNLRMKSEYRPYIKFFFDLVMSDFSVLSISCLLYR
jgi:transposase-like protein